MYVYIYIYIYRERERENGSGRVARESPHVRSAQARAREDKA